MYWNNAIASCSSLVVGLTLTWDVLKWRTTGSVKKWKSWLTLTWDVLKSGNRTINNIIASGLTLTWDVLKLQGRQPCIWWVED